MKYILRCYDYYLSDVYTGTDLITDEKVIIRFEISLDSCKQFDDFEEAEEIRKLIFIEIFMDSIHILFVKTIIIYFYIFCQCVFLYYMKL